MLQIPQKNAEHQEEIVQGVKDWLSERQNWLLILDNADEVDVLIRFIPPKLGGHFIVTTRAADLSNLGLGFGHALTVPKFTKQQDVPFLLHRAGLKHVSSQDSEYARRIADELDGLPLALNQAGVYLAATKSDLASYWELYQHQRLMLLNIHEDREYPRWVAATLLLSFGQVEKRNPAAADLLRLCAFLAPDAIPEMLLTKGSQETGDVLAPVVGDAFQLNRAFADLRAYSLLTRDPHARTLMVHRVLQAVLTDSMSREIKQHWKQRVILVINAAFLESKHENWLQCEQLLPHVLIATRNIEQFSISHEAGRLFHETASYLRDRARYTEAEPFYLRALVVREQQLGFEHPDVARTLNGLAHLYNQQSKYADAELLYQRALAIGEQQLGSEHPDVARTLNGLAVLYYRQGRYTEAEPFYQRALHIWEQQLGLEHPDVAYLLSNLAALYGEQGQYARAERYLQRALQVCEQRLGLDHHGVAYPLSELARLYRKQGRYTEAEPLFQRALQIYEKQLGAESVTTKIAQENYSAVLRVLKENKEEGNVEDQ